MRFIFFGLFIPTPSVHVLFPVRFDDTPSPISFTLPHTLALNVSTVAISEYSDCKKLDRQTLAVFQGSVDGNKIYPTVLFFWINNRPPYTQGFYPSQTTVCVDNRPVGQLDFYAPPELHIDSHPAFPLQIIEFRIFANFGWNHRFPLVACDGCDSSYNTVALKRIQPGLAACSGRREERNPLANAVTDSDQPVDFFPFALSVMDFQLEIWTFSSERLSLSGPDATGMKEPMQVCFYADRNLENGVYLGDVEFKLSESDTGALVVFLLYLGIAFPVICLLTTLLHCYRLKRHRQWVISVKHYFQRLQLEQEMLLPQFSQLASHLEVQENTANQ